MAELIPTYSARSTVSSLNCERPPAKRRKAVGFTMRNIATVRSTSSAVSGFACSNGVPLMGCNRFNGMDCTSSSRKVSASSTRWAGVSPMPMMPPLHTSIPARRAAWSVSIFCACVCVEHKVGKNEGAVSRLQ